MDILQNDRSPRHRVRFHYLQDKPKGSTKTFASYTLLQALSFKGGAGIQGAKQTLLRAGVASLLNASFHEYWDHAIGAGGVFPYTSQQIIDMVNAALASNDRETMLELASELDAINNGIHLIDWDNPPGEPAPAAAPLAPAPRQIDRGVVRTES